MRWAPYPDHGARTIHNGSKPEGFVVISIPLFQVPWVGPDRHPSPTVNDCGLPSPSMTASPAWQRGLGIPNLPATIAENLAIFDCKVGHAVRIEPGLQPLSPKNGNISNIRRRLSAISRRKRPNSESRD